MKKVKHVDHLVCDEILNCATLWPHSAFLIRSQVASLQVRKIFWPMKMHQKYWTLVFTFISFIKRICLLAFLLNSSLKLNAYVGEAVFRHTMTIKISVDRKKTNGPTKFKNLTSSC